MFLTLDKVVLLHIAARALFAVEYGSGIDPILDREALHCGVSAELAPGDAILH